MNTNSEKSESQESRFVENDSKYNFNEESRSISESPKSTVNYRNKLFEISKCKLNN